MLRPKNVKMYVRLTVSELIKFGGNFSGDTYDVNIVSKWSLGY